MPLRSVDGWASSEIIASLGRRPAVGLVEEATGRKVINGSSIKRLTFNREGSMRAAFAAESMANDVAGADGVPSRVRAMATVGSAGRPWRKKRRHGAAVFLIKGSQSLEPAGRLDAIDIVDIDIEWANGVAVVTLVGELDASNSKRLDQCLHEAVSAGNSEVMVDVGRLTFMDSTGLSVIVGAHKRLKAIGGTLTVIAPAPIVMRLFHVVGDVPHLMISDAPKESQVAKGHGPAPKGAA